LESTLRSRTVALLVLLGLALRLPGLLFIGQPDNYEMVIEWGERIRALGLARGFARIYGVLAYALLGWSAGLAEHWPRFWAAGHKIFEIGCEVGIVLIFLKLLQPRWAAVVLVAYWLNPWFIIHGAYHGFLDSPHVLLGLLAVVVLRRVGSSPAGWMTAGVLLFASSQIKPQGLFHLTAPIWMWAGWELLQRRGTPFVRFSLGFLGSALVTALLLWMGGASPLALILNLRSVLLHLPWLSDGGPGLWRFVSYVWMQAWQIPGEVALLRLEPVYLVPMSLFATLLCGGLLLGFIWRVSRSAMDAPSRVYLLMACGALVLSQFGLHAHINHSYGATVLLIPLLPGRRRLQAAWTVMMLFLALAHLSAYGFGSAQLLPAQHVMDKYEYSQPLIDKIRALPAYTSPDALLRFQARAAEVMHVVSSTTISQWSLVMFAAACVALSELYRLAKAERLEGLRL
jgi:hypothetical protein